MKILQISPFDVAGGAEKIAFTLFESYQKLGHNSAIAVGVKRYNYPNVFRIPNLEYSLFYISPFQIFLKKLDLQLKGRSYQSLLNKIFLNVFHPKKILNSLLGYEDFVCPGTSHIFDTLNYKPDIVHCHNLHGGYFDLQELPILSKRFPVILTLHDAWLFSGHCAHSLNCDKWKSGCNICENISIYPRILQDRANRNWNIKKKIYENSSVHIVTPCKWLMEKMNQSILYSGVVSSRIIHNGVNTKIFHYEDQKKVRMELGLPDDKKILLFTANGIRKNEFKDYQALQRCLKIVSSEESSVLCLALGEKGHTEYFGETEIRFIPYQKKEEIIAKYFQSADIYIHPSRVDTFPTTILEAMSCGIPVVASNVGGIPEQVVNFKTGYLIPKGNENYMAKAILDLICDDEKRFEFGMQARKLAETKFCVERMVDEYIKYYNDILNYTKNI